MPHEPTASQMLSVVTVRVMMQGLPEQVAKVRRQSIIKQAGEVEKAAIAARVPKMGTQGKCILHGLHDMVDTELP